MKQFTSKEQTDRLIEAGFPAPRIASPCLGIEEDYILVPRYTLGELVEMLPIEVDSWELSIKVGYFRQQWMVEYGCHADYIVIEAELVDAIYEMLLKLAADKRI